MPIEKAYAFTDLFALARAGSAWRINAAGALEEVAANGLRVDYDPATLAARGVLVEQVGTNEVTNPRAEGAVAGTPGTLPTNWADGGTFGRRIVGVGTEAGIPYVDIRSVGTTGPTDYIWIQPAGYAYAVPAVSGEAWAGRIHHRLVAGVLPAFTGALRVQLDIDNGGTPTGSAQTVFTPTAAGLAQQFTDVTATATVGAAFARLSFAANHPVSTAIDFTLRIGMPQLWKSSVVLSPSLPPVSTPAASTRAADDLSMTEIERWLNPAQGTFVIDFTPGKTTAGANRGLLQLSDGTVNNRIRLRMLAANTNLRFSADVGGVEVATMDQASGAALTRHTARVSYGPSGWLMSVNGAAPVSAAGAVPPNLTVCRLGRAAASGEYLNGWLGPRVNYYPTQYTDTAAADGFTIRTR